MAAIPWVGHEPADTLQRSHKKERRSVWVKEMREGLRVLIGGGGEMGVCKLLARNVTY